MPNPRRITSTTAGPAHLHIEMHGVHGTITVHADPAHKVAAVAVMTDDDTGPAAEAIAGARLTNDGGLAVRIQGRPTGATTTIGRTGSTITISGNVAGQIIVNGVALDGGTPVSPIEVMAHVPPGSTVTTSTLSADLHTTGPLAELDATSISGQVCARGPIAQLHANTTSGNVRFTAAGHARVNTTSGDVHAAAVTGPGLFRSVSGDVRVHAAGRANITASTISGDITITADRDAEANGPAVSAHSISGTVRTPRG